MHVLLDTNIYIEDITFSRPDIKALRSYLEKTNSFLIVPNVVEREVRKYIDIEAHKDHDRLRAGIANRLGLIDQSLSREFLTQKLSEHFDKSMRGIRRKELNFKKLNLEELVERSLQEKAPFLKSDKGMRDTIIWLCLIEELKSLKKDEKVVLISNNSNDFGVNGELKQSLKEELKVLGLEDKVIYYNCLSDFLVDFEKPIAYIDDYFIKNAIDDYMDHYSGYDESDLDLDLDHRGRDYEVNDVEYDGFEIERYYVYDETEGEYVIYVEASANYSIAVTYTEIEYEYDYDYGGPVPSYNRESSYEPTSVTAEFFVKVNKSSNSVSEVEYA